MAIVRANVLICAGSACVSSRAYEFKDALIEALKEAGIREEVNVVDTGCVGTCDLGPVAIVYPDGVFYVRLKPEDAKTIVNEHLLKGRVVNRLLYQEPMTKEVFPSLSEIDFVAKQRRIVLRNMGIINPESIEEYIAREGYQALATALTMTPEEVIDTVKRSGLRGRGGAGFPTGLKWELTRKASGSPKYVICNGDEGDPGAFMDRSILEGDPHSVIEGMMIAGYAVGASKGFFYVRAEYPLAIKRLEMALEQARSYGLIGENILGTGFSFDIELRRGSGAFVCGEETALIASIEGRRGEPRPRPPYPANRGLWDKPTVINNVETLANIAPIILNGAEWFSSIGTEKSKGTKVFALAGKVNNTGLIEVPFGTTLREIIFEVGGGIPGGKKFKAAQTGGPSGGCIPAEYLDLPLDYESLKQIGAIVGSGGLIIMDEDTCMVDVARFFLEFTQSESCGKCPPCRVGTRKMLDILERIINGEGEEGDIERLIELGNEIKQDSLCGLGQTAPNPVLSTIRFFRDEYEAHIKEKRCPAKSCRALIAYHVIPDKCKGCGICARICPVGAAQGKPREVHFIDKDLCIKCGDCFAKCPFGAIEKIDIFSQKS